MASDASTFSLEDASNELMNKSEKSREEIQINHEVHQVIRIVLILELSATF